MLSAAKDPTDPALRVDSVLVLKNDSGEDVRDALVDVAQNDPNAGVRLKAVEALARFSNNAQARQALIDALAHDDNADVRTQAVNLLVPPNARAAFNPQLADTLQSAMKEDTSGYIRSRCREALQAMKVSVDVYYPSRPRPLPTLAS